MHTFLQTKMEQQNIAIMLSVKMKMEKIPFRNQDNDYKRIHQLCKRYLREHCEHEIIYDDIDMDLDTSKTIVYCKKCETCFS
jgi:hypothetical protein